jgi:hypothetical protein
MLVFVEYAAESASAADVESVWLGKRIGGRPEGRAVQGAVVPVLVVDPIFERHTMISASFDAWPRQQHQPAEGPRS